MPCKNLSFLVIEDNEFQRRCLSTLLTNLGAATVQTAEDGEAALHIIAGCEQPIDIVICDVSMPGMDGMEFVRRWSERGDPTSLIMMSAIEPDLLATVANMALAYQARLIGVASKPATAAKLTPLIELHRARAAVPSSDAEFSFQELTQLWAGDEFECWFEPQIALANGGFRSVAAVPRWRHPTKGVLGPERFMSAVHARGLGDDLAWLLLQRAAAQCKRWLVAGDGLVATVPLAFASLADAQLTSRIQHVLQQEGLDPRAMVLTVNESALAGADLARVLENLARLRLLGFGLAIDNFGAGSMEIDKLSLAAFTELRIKSSFVAGAECDESARAGLAVALEAAQGLKVRSVATGVSSRGEWALLQAWGCGYGEGPFIAPAIAGSEMLRWLQRWKQRHLATA